MEDSTEEASSQDEAVDSQDEGEDSQESLVYI